MRLWNLGKERLRRRQLGHSKAPAAPGTLRGPEGQCLVKAFCLCLFAFLFLPHCAKSISGAAIAEAEPLIVLSYVTQITQWQEELNQQYRDPDHSPLPALDREVFTAHPFFPIDSSYRVTALLSYTSTPLMREMPTSSGSMKMYRVWALALFELHGKEQSIQLLQPAGLTSGPTNYLFIPFQDLTSGNSTYGGGRYIDMPLPKGSPETLIIDFNRAYHPYCAYTDGYNCPIPPPENRMTVAVKAGIKL